MSCHTWAYRMIAANELNAAKEHIIECLRANYQYVPEGISLEEHVDKEFNIISKTYGDKITCTKEQFADMIKNSNIRIRKLIKKLQGDYTMKDVAKACELCGGKLAYKIVANSLYKECGFDEPCRIYCNSGESFTDADKFIKWIKDSEKCGKPISEYYDSKKNVYNRGFNKLMERKIRDFWAKYNNKVYVEFV